MTPEQLRIVLSAAEDTLLRVNDDPDNDSYVEELSAALQAVAEHGESMDEEIPVDSATKRRGDWTQTHSRRRYFAFEPYASDLDPADIAFGLANVTRFGGQSPWYSVLIHTYRVAEVSDVIARRRGLDDEQRLLVRAHALLHDASEAYIGDMQKPIKRFLTRYCEAEDLGQAAILELFKLPPPDPFIEDIVKTADLAVLLLEAEELFPDSYRAWPVANMPHAELDAELRAAFEIPSEWHDRLRTIRELIDLWAQDYHQRLQHLKELVEEESGDYAEPESQKPSGQSSWRGEIRRTRFVDVPETVPEHEMEEVAGEIESSFIENHQRAERDETLGMSDDPFAPPPHVQRMLEEDEVGDR